jgi:ElaA protein
VRGGDGGGHRVRRPGAAPFGRSLSRYSEIADDGGVKSTATATAAGSATESPALTWRWCRFDELSVFELDAIYRARQQVFCVEQECAYLDADGFDAESFHLAAWAPSQPLPWAYARVVRPGLKYAEPSIGRVITTAAARGTGLGRELLQRSIALTQQTFPGAGIRISAQSRLEAFYAAAGFVIVGESYLEDDLPHTEMLRVG